MLVAEVTRTRLTKQTTNQISKLVKTFRTISPKLTNFVSVVTCLDFVGSSELFSTYHFSQSYSYSSVNIQIRR